MQLRPNSIPTLNIIDSRTNCIDKTNNASHTSHTDVLMENDDAVTTNDSIENASYTDTVTTATASSPDDDHCNGHISVSNSIKEQTWCAGCMQKDELIEKKDLQIKELRKKLKCTRTKIWHMESIKRKLSAALSDLKTESIIDENLYETLQVCIFSIFQKDATYNTVMLVALNSANRTYFDLCFLNEIVRSKHILRVLTLRNITGIKCLIL